MEETFARANANAERGGARRRRPTSPRSGPAPPVELHHVCRAAPAHAPGGPSRRPRLPARRSPAAAAARPTPVFVVGADRSGASALACALGQHPAIAAAACTAAGIGERSPAAGRGRPRAALEEDPATFGVEPPDADGARGGCSAGRLTAARRRPRASWWVDALVAARRAMSPSSAALFPEAQVHPHRARRATRGARAGRPAAGLRRRPPAAPRCRRGCVREVAEREARRALGRRRSAAL